MKSNVTTDIATMDDGASRALESTALLIDATNLMTSAARPTFMMCGTVAELAALSIVTIGITITMNMIGGRMMRRSRTPEKLPRGQPRARNCCASCAAGTITIIDIGLETSLNITASIKMSLTTKLTRTSMGFHKGLNFCNLVDAYTQTNPLVAPISHPSTRIWTREGMVTETEENLRGRPEVELSSVQR